VNLSACFDRKVVRSRRRVGQKRKRGQPRGEFLLDLVDVARGSPGLCESDKPIRPPAKVDHARPQPPLDPAFRRRRADGPGSFGAQAASANSSSGAAAFAENIAGIAAGIGAEPNRTEVALESDFQSGSIARLDG